MAEKGFFGATASEIKRMKNEVHSDLGFKKPRSTRRKKSRSKKR